MHALPYHPSGSRTHCPCPISFALAPACVHTRSPTYKKGTHRHERQVDGLEGVAGSSENPPLTPPAACVLPLLRNNSPRALPHARLHSNHRSSELVYHPRPHAQSISRAWKRNHNKGSTLRILPLPLHKVIQTMPMPFLRAALLPIPPVHSLPPSTNQRRHTSPRHQQRPRASQGSQGPDILPP
jgi:hypothetical protein